MSATHNVSSDIQAQKQKLRPNKYNRSNNSHASQTQDTPSKERRHRYRANDDQLQCLIDVYNYDANPSRTTLNDLALKIQMPFQSVYVWFKNRRARVPRTVPSKPPNSNICNPSSSSLAPPVLVPKSAAGGATSDLPSIPLTLPLTGPNTMCAGSSSQLQLSSSSSKKHKPHLQASNNGSDPVSVEPPRTRSLIEARGSTFEGMIITKADPSLVKQQPVEFKIADPVSPTPVSENHAEKKPFNEVLDDMNWKPNVGDVVHVFIENEWTKATVDFMIPRKGYRVTELKNRSALWVRSENLKKFDGSSQT